MVYLFLGCDEYLTSRRLAELKAALGDPELASLNTLELMHDKTSANQLLAQASMMPFLSERRLIVVSGYLNQLDKRMAMSKNPDSAAHSEAAALLTGLRTLPETCDLIFVEPELDRRRLLWKGFALGEHKIGGLEDLIKWKHAILESLPTPDIKLLPTWIQQHAKEQKIVIDGRAIQMLTEFVGPELRRIHMELDKLRSYTGGGRPIVADDVRAMVSDTGEEAIWNLTDALSQRSPRAAMRALVDLRRTDDNPFGLLQSIVRHYRLLIKVKTLLQAGVNNELEIAKQLGEKPYPAKKAMGACSHYALQQLDAIMARLLAANVAMVTGGDQNTEIDILIAELTTQPGQPGQHGAAAKHEGARMRG